MVKISLTNYNIEMLLECYIRNIISIYFKHILVDTVILQ